MPEMAEGTRLKTIDGDVRALKDKVDEQEKQSETTTTCLTEILRPTRI